MPSNNNKKSDGNSNRGRFLLGRGPSLRRPQKKSTETVKPKGGVLHGSVRPKTAANPIRGGGPHLSIYDDAANEQQQQQQQQENKRVSFVLNRPHRSMSPIANSETVDATGFSKAELHDLEESFKLFDIYGEGNVQVGDLRGILEVLDQEQKQHQEEDQLSHQHPRHPSATTATPLRFPHLTTLLDRLSELSDEDTLSLEDYIQLMASTTISTSIAIEKPNSTGGSPRDHFERVFRLFDSGDKGYITIKDLQRIAVELGEYDMTKGELQEMIDRALGKKAGHDDNANGNVQGKVGIEEFTRMMTTSLFPSN
mmetsp:Transcript_15283/g.35420  ORF Transcript_15283/g.35420 Transcript_15283/m.35420 type:complete len:311 (-) Transcript_15283:68-1000(-)